MGRRVPATAQGPGRGGTYLAVAPALPVPGQGLGKLSAVSADGWREGVLTSPPLQPQPEVLAAAVALATLPRGIGLPGISNDANVSTAATGFERGDDAAVGCAGSEEARGGGASEAVGCAACVDAGGSAGLPARSTRAEAPCLPAAGFAGLPARSTTSGVAVPCLGAGGFVGLLSRSMTMQEPCFSSTPRFAFAAMEASTILARASASSAISANSFRAKELGDNVLAVDGLRGGVTSTLAPTEIAPLPPEPGWPRPATGERERARSASCCIFGNGGGGSRAATGEEDCDRAAATAAGRLGSAFGATTWPSSAGRQLRVGVSCAATETCVSTSVAEAPGCCGSSNADSGGRPGSLRRCRRLGIALATVGHALAASGAATRASHGTSPPSAPPLPPAPGPGVASRAAGDATAGCGALASTGQAAAGGTS